VVPTSFLTTKIHEPTRNNTIKNLTTLFTLADFCPKLSHDGTTWDRLCIDNKGFSVLSHCPTFLQFLPGDQLAVVRQWPGFQRSRALAERRLHRLRVLRVKNSITHKRHKGSNKEQRPNHLAPSAKPTWYFIRSAGCNNILFTEHIYNFISL